MFTTQYQLYLGHNNPVLGFDYTRKEVAAWCEAFITEAFPGFTLTKAVGYWNRVNEQTTIVTILGNEDDIDAVKRIAKWYKSVHNQEAVLVTTTQLKGELV